MPPPNLAGNTPVANVFQPVIIGLVPSIRNDARLTGFYCLNGFLCQRFCLYKPLSRQIRFHHGMASVTVPNAVLIWFDFFQQFFFFQGFYNGLAGFESIQAFKFSRLGCHHSVITNHFNRWQIVSQSDFKIVGIMGGCNL